MDFRVTQPWAWNHQALRNYHCLTSNKLLRHQMWLHFLFSPSFARLTKNPASQFLLMLCGLRKWRFLWQTSKPRNMVYPALAKQHSTSSHAYTKVPSALHSAGSLSTLIYTDIHQQQLAKHFSIPTVQHLTKTVWKFTLWFHVFVLFEP